MGQNQVGPAGLRALRQWLQDGWLDAPVQSPHLQMSLRVQRWPLLLAALLLTAELLRPARTWVVLMAGLLALLLLMAAWAWYGGWHISLERHLRHQWTQVGDLLEERFILSNSSFFPAPAVEVEDLSSIPGYTQSAVRAVPGRGQTEWLQRGRSQQRGVYLLGPTRIRFTDPLGLVEIAIHDQRTRELLVMPPVLSSIDLLLTRGGGQGAVTARQRHPQESASVGGIRDYHPGDPIRRIHWPLSSRHNRYLVRDFDREMGGHIWLALDLDARVHSGEAADSSIEDLVVWAASWAWHLSVEGKAVGLFAYGPECTLIPPRAGSAYLLAILRALALLNSQSEMPVTGLLDELVPWLRRGDSLVLMTPSLDPDWPLALIRPRLQSIARAALLIETAEAPTARLVAMRALLGQLRIPCAVAAPRSRLAATPAMPGSGDWDFVTTPSGRVIVRSRPAEVRP
jgi:uncharacterized protein (DUF58 family)